MLVASKQGEGLRQKAEYLQPCDSQAVSAFGGLEKCWLKFDKHSGELGEKVTEKVLRSREVTAAAACCEDLILCHLHTGVGSWWMAVSREIAQGWCHESMLQPRYDQV